MYGLSPCPRANLLLLSDQCCAEVRYTRYLWSTALSTPPTISTIDANNAAATKKKKGGCDTSQLPPPSPLFFPLLWWWCLFEYAYSVDAKEGKIRCRVFLPVFFLSIRFLSFRCHAWTTSLCYCLCLICNAHWKNSLRYPNRKTTGVRCHEREKDGRKMRSSLACFSLVRNVMSETLFNSAKNVCGTTQSSVFMPSGEMAIPQRVNWNPVLWCTWSGAHAIIMLFCYVTSPPSTTSKQSPGHAHTSLSISSLSVSVHK